MTQATIDDIDYLVSGFSGELHGNTSDGQYDVEFPNAVTAMAFARLIMGYQNSPLSLASSWVSKLNVRIRQGDSITDISQPVVLTIW